MLEAPLRLPRDAPVCAISKLSGSTANPPSSFCKATIVSAAVVSSDAVPASNAS